MPSLFVHCKSCGASFASGIAVDAADAGKVLMFDVFHRCPKCGHLAAYSTPDYSVPIEMGEAKGAAAASREKPGPSDRKPGRKNGAKPKPVPGESTVASRLGLTPTEVTE